MLILAVTSKIWYVSDQLRVLVAAGTVHIVSPLIKRELPAADVTAAINPHQLRLAVRGRVRYDAVLTDLIWNDPRLEYAFDGLDVIAALREEDRVAPVIIAAQGQSLELDHLAEALTHPEVVGVIYKTVGPAQLAQAITIAAAGKRLPVDQYPTGVPAAMLPIETYFTKGRRGQAAAHLAGAIAAHRACDAPSLAAATGMSINTVNKLTAYLGPLIRARHEHPDDLPITSQTVYRWCGEHAHYLSSWNRRHTDSH